VLISCYNCQLLNKPWHALDDLLEGSLRLLDICGIVQECLFRSKENMHVVLSVIRRTGTGVEFIIENENYLSSRKNSKGLMKFERNKKPFDCFFFKKIQ
jgi:hypothetical protein